MKGEKCDSYVFFLLLNFKSQQVYNKEIVFWEIGKIFYVMRYFHHETLRK